MNITPTFNSIEIIVGVNKCLTNVGVLSVRHLLAGVFAGYETYTHQRKHCIPFLMINKLVNKVISQP